MKSRTLPVKRKPVSKGVFRRLSAVTRSRKQRVAAAATPTELEAEDAGSKVSRALVIIFMIHVVAIVLIFVHQKFLDGRTPERSAETAAPVAAPAPPRENLPRLANGGRAYVVKTGDNYARIAAAEGVDEAELRAFNNNVDIEPKLLLNIPPKRIVAEEPPEVVSIRENVPSDVDRGLVEVVPVDVSSAPKAQLVRPAAAGTQPAAVSSGRSYVVKPGDSIWRISQNFSVDQNALMKLNGIEDARKMKVGMTLRIPLNSNPVFPVARYCSILLCAAVATLVALGLVMLASTSAWVRGVEAPYHFLSRQTLMVCAGLVAAVFAARWPFEHYRKVAPWLFVFVSVLLALCYVPGIGVSIFGSKRWIQLPLIGQFQPSEFAKIVVVICVAAWFARWQTETRTFWRGFVLPGIIAGVPILLIAGETDVGSALSLSVTVAALLFCAGTRWFYLFPTAVAAISGASWYVYNNENRWGRIQAWLDLENPIHQLDRGMQQWRALLALGNGGPWGVGLGNGNEKFGTLTFAHIDFIFPVVGEELGLPATLGVILCYVVIAIAGCGIAMQATHIFSRLLALGLTFIIVVPAMVNIGVTTAVLPNDGLPLPFVSYGGTSLVFSLMAVGMLVGIHRRSQPKVAEEFPLTRETRLAVRL